jgi:hypothetical protein
MEERRSNLTAAMDRDRDRASVLMDPALVTSSLTAPFKTEPQGSATELHGAGARHSRLRCCLPGAAVPSRRIRRQSFQTRLRVGQGLFSRWHQRKTPANGRDFRHPAIRLVPTQNYLVGVKTHPYTVYTRSAAPLERKGHALTIHFDP